MRPNSKNSKANLSSGAILPVATLGLVSGCAGASSQSALIVGVGVVVGALVVLGLVGFVGARLLRRPPRDPEDRRRYENIKRKHDLRIRKLEQEELLENARDLVRDNPDKTAKLLRSWLQEDEDSDKDKGRRRT